MDAGEPVRSAPGEVDARRVIDHHDVRVVAVTTIGVEANVPCESVDKRLEVEVARDHLVSAPFRLDAHSVPPPVEERRVLQGEVPVVVDGEAACLAVRI